MAKKLYTVEIVNVREVEMLATIEVEAESQGEAEDEAIRIAGAGDYGGYRESGTLDWHGPEVNSCDPDEYDEDAMDEDDD